ncbi:MAG: PASTA domain-containing protein [Bacteroidales bacterium]|nr:PASTA domain-containing protein [Candidatus Cacconaster scatequi]
MDKPKKKNRWFLKNLIAAAVVITVLILAAQLFLSIRTRHGQEIEVPDFTSKTLEEAANMASQSNFRLDVTDSVFMSRLPKGSIYSQKPAPGSKVKEGRRILLTINATQMKKVSMPNLVGLSLRQARTQLQEKGLIVGKLTYKEDIATNNVLEQTYRGKKIAPGKKIECENRIDLVLGLDPNNSTTYIPHLIGYSYGIAFDNIIDNSLNLGKVRYDETVKTYSDTLSAIVYFQDPDPNSEESEESGTVEMGTTVNISLTVSQAKVAAASLKEESFD